MSNGEVIIPRESQQSRGTWAPIQGQEVRNLIRHLALDAESSDRLVSEAAEVLSQCISPAQPGNSTTGLVLGYVQSGKTLSFTTVAALARDNGYPMVIVITGISNPLLDQSTSRLEQDLRLQGNRKWRLFRNPKIEDKGSIENVLADWRDERLSDHRRKSVLVTVLKNTSNLRNLNSVLEAINLKSLPVLVIDDEADQAGLNTAVAKGRQSTTYQRLVTLRQNLPHHGYLQYTATPQAPLLINIIDALSPRFVELLTPGDEYVGGQVFFEDRPELVRAIPSTDVPARNNPLDHVPDSLLSALRLFFLGVAAGFVLSDDQEPGRNRSMLVHPSRETTGHGQFYHWITRIKLQWLDVLSLSEDDAERTAFLDLFRPEYQDLAATVADLPAFDVLAAELEYAVRHTEILEVNAAGKETPQPEWRNAYPWILVGGQAMDRGFTVEGLTVTYMPRNLGVGNADTIEQRARFFGYKRRYLGYCRVFLESGVRDAFHFYVEHERDIRDRLQAHRDTGRPLNEWRRAFFLDSGLSPTRRQVLDLDFRHDSLSDDWFWPKVPHGTAELVSANRALVDTFLNSTTWDESTGDPRRTADQIHDVADGVSLGRVCEDLLVPFRFTEERDSQLCTGLLLQIKAFLDEQPDAKCTVYNMSRGAARLRSVNDNEEIPTLFQGANYADNKRKDDMIYAGDREIRTEKSITVQIHNLEVRQKKQGSLIANNVAAIAIWVPAALAKDWVVQSK